MTWLSAALPYVGGGVFGAAVAFGLTWVPERRRTLDAYALPENPALTFATSRKQWATRHRPSPRTSTATSTPTSWTKSQPTSISYTQQKLTYRRPDKNRTNQTNRRVRDRCLCR